MRPSGKHAAAAVVTRGGAIAAAAANAEDWGISAGIRRIRDGGRDCLPWGRNGIWSAGFRTGFFVTRKISGGFVNFVGGVGVCGVVEYLLSVSARKP
jgi:hypothetical protein